MHPRVGLESEAVGDRAGAVVVLVPIRSVGSDKDSGLGKSSPVSFAAGRTAAYLMMMSEYSVQGGPTIYMSSNLREGHQKLDWAQRTMGPGWEETAVVTSGIHIATPEDNRERKVIGKPGGTFAVSLTLEIPRQ